MQRATAHVGVGPPSGARARAAVAFPALALPSLRGRGVLRRGGEAAVAAAFVVWLAHASVGRDWRMPAVTGTALVLAATLVHGGRRRRSERSRAPSAVS